MTCVVDVERRLLVFRVEEVWAPWAWDKSVIFCFLAFVVVDVVESKVCRRMVVVHHQTTKSVYRIRSILLRTLNYCAAETNI